MKIKEDSNYISFTDWYVVKIVNDGKIKEEKFPDFLKNLRKHIKSPNFNVFYSNNKFIITYDGKNYQVVLGGYHQKTLESGKYSPLVAALMSLAQKEEKYSKEIASQAARQKKIDAINSSNYEDLVDPEDIEFYIEFLNGELENATDVRQKGVITTKIANCLQMLYGMERETSTRNNSTAVPCLDIVRYVNDMISELPKVTDKDRPQFARTLREILTDYRARVEDYIKHGNKKIYIDNPMYPMDILDRVVSAEFELKQLIQQRKISDCVGDTFSDIEEELRRMAKGSAK